MKTHDTILETQRDRIAIYGHYKNNVRTRAAVMYYLKSHNMNYGTSRLSEENLVMVEDLVSKIVRHVTSPSHMDTLLDLASYTMLIYEIKSSEVSS